MLPRLYASTTTNSEFFEHNGLGFIKNCKKCLVTEERHGEYELEAEFLANDRLANSIVPMNYIVIKANAVDNPQIFEIYSVTKTQNIITVKAQHIRYRLSGYVFNEPYFETTAVSPSQTWTAIQEYLVMPQSTQEFTYHSNIITESTPWAAWQHPVRLTEFLLGADGSMLDLYGGEFKFDNFDIYQNSRRGSDSGVVIRTGTGAVSNIEITVSTDRMFTKISPYAEIPLYNNSGTEVLWDVFEYLTPTTVQDSQYFPGRALSLDCTELFSRRYSSFRMIANGSNSAPDQASEMDAKNKIQTIVNSFINANEDVLKQPSVNLNIELDATVSDLQGCSLCDTIAIYYDPMNISLTAKIIKTTYDALAERYTSMSIATAKKGLSAYFRNSIIGSV